MEENSNNEEQVNLVDTDESNEIEKGNAQEAIRKLSEGEPEVIKQMTAMMGVSSFSNPLHDKMNEQHVSTVLELAVKHDEREFELAKGNQSLTASNRWFGLSVFFVMIIFVGFVLLLFKDKPDILIPIITAIITLPAGFAGGWGYAKHKSD